ncbi:hypothetical protein Ndes2437B_g07950 [Nannochloris sp. 'desiccata']
MGLYIDQPVIPSLLADSAFPVEHRTSNPSGAMPARYHTPNHPSTSPTVAIHAKLPYGARANSVSAELISSSSPPAVVAVAPDYSASAGSCGTELCVDPSRSVTPESIPQPLARNFTAAASPSTIVNLPTTSVLPESTTSRSHTTTTGPFTSSNTACPTATWRRVQYFIKVSTHSPLLASALAALDVAGHPSVGDQAPPATGGDSLRWTLSAMLALFLRSNAPTVCEESLLAILWTMESWSDARRSPATLVLGDYIKHLAAFDPDRAESMSVTWRASFCALRSAVVEAQIELLQNLEWSVRLTDGAILHCHKLLFGAFPQKSTTAKGSTAAAVAVAAAAEAEAWSAAAAAVAADSKRTRSWRDPSGACADQVNALCACVVAQSSRIAAVEARKLSIAAAVCAAQSKKRAAATASPMFSTGTEESSYDSCTVAPLVKRFRRGSVTAVRISFGSSSIP